MGGNGRQKRRPLGAVTCPRCGAAVPLPFIWMVGIESVFACKGCKTRFCTGYKAGAVLFALAFVAAVATVNLACLVLGSRSMTVLFYAAVPLWIVYGIVLRRAWLVLRARKHSGRQRNS